MLLLISFLIFLQRGAYGADNGISSVSSESKNFTLASLRSVDYIYASASEITRVQNVDVIRRGSLADEEKGDEEPVQGEADGEIAICNLNYLAPLSVIDRETQKRRPSNVLHTVEGAVAVALAAHHLNTGDGSVVKAVGGLNERCNVRFNLQSFETSWSQIQGVNQVIEMTEIDTDQDVVEADGQVRQQQPKKRLPCAILGAVMSGVSMPTAIISGLKGYLQISPLSTTDSLNDRVQYPLFARTIPAASSSAIIVVKYVSEVLHAKHLAVLHTNDPEGSSFSIALQQAATFHAPDLQVVTFDVPTDWTPDIIRRVVGDLKDTGYMFFFGALNQYMFDELMDEAVLQGIAGTGIHNWMFSGGKDFAARIYERNSSHAKAMPGVAMVSATGFLPRQEILEKLYDSLKHLAKQEDDMAIVRSKLPTYSDVPNGTDIFEGVFEDDSFLQTVHTRGIVSWVYDAAIAAGLAACSATNTATEEEDGNDGRTSYAYFDGKSHFASLVQTTFDGATGKVTFDNVTGTREAAHAQFKVINIQSNDEKSNDTHVGFQEVVTSIYQDGTFVEVEPFVYNDGTTQLPSDLPPLYLNQNHLPTGIRGGGLLMSGIVLVLGCICSGWTYWDRDARVIKSAQPIFLHILCFGTFILGSSIIPLSLDEGVTDARGCDVACITFPWLLSVGFSLIFSALSAKTHRINKIFQNPGFTRIIVSVMDVMKPMFAVLGGKFLKQFESLLSAFSRLLNSITVPCSLRLQPICLY